MNARQLLRRARRAAYGAWFDLAGGVDTASSVRGPNHRGDLQRYQPSETWQLTRILPRSEVGPGDVFVDVGAGKGRVVIAAARYYGFRRVVGVELSAELHAIARRNVERLTTPASVVLDHADVLRWEVPADATVFYLFNPFVGDTFRAFLGRLLDSQRVHPRRIRLVYAYPVMHPVVEAAGFEVVRSMRQLTLYQRLPAAA
jgi:predicted RNA methylase